MRPLHQVAISVGILLTLLTTNASAQPAVNLTGKYRCVQGCAPGFENNPAFVTQNGWDINLVTEAGAPVRAWFDWFSPTRIWIEAWHQGAVYSSDGATIQFDRGAVWQRDFGQPSRSGDAATYCKQRYRSYDSISGTYLGYDGKRHSCP
jgi:hypothetical protein